MRSPCRRTVPGRSPRRNAVSRAWSANHATASSATRSSAPGSSKRWVAPGTISSRVSHRIRACACRLSSSTCVSAPPTISSVGALTTSSASAARSGRPPRETTAATSGPRCAAATRAAAAPVLAPKNAIGSSRTSGSARSHPTAPSSRLARSAMSKTLPRSCASTSVSRSNSSVARPATRRRSATSTFRGDRRLEPLPCANATTAFAPSGITRSPGRVIPSETTETDRRSGSAISGQGEGPARGAGRPFRRPSS